MLRVLLDQPNVLLLDEPTNDLDIDTLTVLEDFLDDWPGSVFVVSHDRYFLERVCDHIWALPGDGTFTMLTGGVEDYLARRSGGSGSSTRAGSAGPTRSRKAGAPRAADGKGGPAQRRTAGKELARIERQLAKLDVRESRLHADMAETASDFARVCALDTELRALLTEKAQLEESWLETAADAETPGV